MVREMRTLQSQAGAPRPPIGCNSSWWAIPTGPTAASRSGSPGLYVPLLDIPLDGSTPLDTPYATTDISWEYDAASTS